MKIKIITIFQIIILSFVIFKSPCVFGKTKDNKQNNRYDNNPILATVDGEPVYLNEVVTKDIHDLLEKLYKSLGNAAAPLVMEKLKKKHPEFVKIKKVKITDDEIKNFYNNNNLSRQGSFNDLKGQIKMLLEGKNTSRQIAQKITEAINYGWVENYISPPEEFLITANFKQAHIRGNPEAKVALLEFSDYQCPFCGRVQNSIKYLIKKYEKKVAFGYRHFPLPFHRQADEAAIAAECARDQGKFSEMHNLLFSRVRNQSIKELKQYGRDIKISSQSKYEECIDTEKYRGRVNNDREDAAMIGINGTPGFIIGNYNSKTKTIRGEIISGALPRDYLESNIKKYLKKNR